MIKRQTAEGPLCFVVLFLLMLLAARCPALYAQDTPVSPVKSRALLTGHPQRSIRIKGGGSEKAKVPSGPLSLSQAVEIALAQSPELDSRKDQVQASKAGLSESKARFFPAVTGKAGYRRLGDQLKLGTPEITSVSVDTSSVNPAASPTTLTLPATIPATTFDITEDELREVKVGIKQEVFAGGRLANAYKKSRQRVIISKEQCTAARNGIVLTVKTNYFAVLKALKGVQMQRLALKRSQQHLKDVTKRFETKSMPKIELYRARLDLSNRQQSLFEAEARLEIQKAHFNYALSRDLKAPVVLEDVVGMPDVAISLEKCLTVALKNRPEIKEWQAKLRSARYDTKIVRGGYYPNIYCGGEYRKTKGIEWPIDEWQENWEAGIFLEMNIWDWGRTKSKVGQAKLQEGMTRKHFLQIEAQIEMDVRDAYQDMLIMSHKCNESEKAVVLAEEAQRITKIRFQEGLATNTRVLEAQSDLLETQTNHFNNLYDCHVALARLEWAMGGGFPVDALSALEKQPAP